MNSARRNWPVCGYSSTLGKSTQSRPMVCCLGLLLLLAGPDRLVAAQVYRDPAPPAVQKLPELPPPAPQQQAGLKFHTAPKPLAAGAVTHDWRCFLGPTYNAVSTETPLR